MKNDIVFKVFINVKVLCRIRHAVYFSKKGNAEVGGEISRIVVKGGMLE